MSKKKEKLKLTGDWYSEMWFPITLIKRLFGWYKPKDWNHLSITYNADKKVIDVWLNGQKLVSGRRKMTAEEFEEMINDNI